MSGEKLVGKLKQYSIFKTFDMYARKIPNWKFGSVLTAAYRSDSRKTYCKVGLNAII